MAEYSLEGLRVLVTRAAHQADKLSAMLRELKAEVFELPLISVGPPDSWENLDKALSMLSDYEWILFASVNAVEAVLKRLEDLGSGTLALGTQKLAAIGLSTAAALEAAGLKADFAPTRFIAEALVEEFPGYPDLQGTRMLWPRTNVGRNYIADKLTAAGARVDVVESYKTSLPDNPEGLAKQLVCLVKENGLQVITLTSSQSAKNLALLLNLQPDAGPLIDSVAIACIGPETLLAARKSLGRADLQAEDYTIEGLVQALCEWHRNCQGGAQKH